MTVMEGVNTFVFLWVSTESVNVNMASQESQMVDLAPLVSNSYDMKKI